MSRHRTILAAYLALWVARLSTAASGSLYVRNVTSTSDSIIIEWNDSMESERLTYTFYPTIAQTYTYKILGIKTSNTTVLSGLMPSMTYELKVEISRNSKTILDKTTVTTKPLSVLDECEEFVVSPDLVNFTSHPQPTATVGKGQSITLECRAEIQSIGGFRIVDRDDDDFKKKGLSRPFFAKKIPWREYVIRWEYRSLVDNSVRLVEDGVIPTKELNSTQLQSTLTTTVEESGLYSCFVEDWDGKLKYYSQSSHITTYPVVGSLPYIVDVSRDQAVLYLTCSEPGMTSVNQLVSPSVNWTFDHQGQSNITSHGNLIIHNPQGMNGSEVLCTAQVSSSLTYNISYLIQVKEEVRPPPQNITYHAKIGDAVELFCNLLFNRSEDLNNVSWSYKRSTYVGPLWVIPAATKMSEGTYQCMSGLAGNYSIELKVYSLEDEETPSSPPNSTTQYIGEGRKNLLLCHQNSSVEWYFEWFRNGARLGLHQDKMSAVEFGVYVCRSYHGSFSVSRTYRVLPLGCMNPVQDLEYPKLELSNGQLVAELSFCWRAPSHLGGLSEESISYEVELMPYDGQHDGKAVPNISYSRPSNGKICYSATFNDFSGMINSYSISRRRDRLHKVQEKNLLLKTIDITVAAHYNDSTRMIRSVATRIPQTTIMSWVTLHTTKSCNRHLMTLSFDASELSSFVAWISYVPYVTAYCFPNSTYKPEIDYARHILGELTEQPWKFLNKDANPTITLGNVMSTSITCEGTVLVLPLFNAPYWKQSIQPYDYNLCDVPKAPENLSVVDTSSSSVTLVWGRPETIGQDQYSPKNMSYEINITHSENQPHCLQLWNVSSDTEKMKISGLCPFTNYTFEVVAKNSDGYGIETATIRQRTNEWIPSAPENLTVSNVSFTSFVVEWEPPLMPNGIIRSYHVEYTSTEARGGTLVVLTGTHVVLTGLKHSTEYTVYVSARTIAGEGNASEVKHKTAEIPLKPLYTAGISTLALLVTWMTVCCLSIVVCQFVLRKKTDKIWRRRLTLKPLKNYWKEDVEEDAVTVFEENGCIVSDAYVMSTLAKTEPHPSNSPTVGMVTSSESPTPSEQSSSSYVGIGYIPETNYQSERNQPSTSSCTAGNDITRPDDRTVQEDVGIVSVGHLAAHANGHVEISSMVSPQQPTTRHDPHQEYVPAPEPTVGPARRDPHQEYIPAPEPTVGPARHTPHPEYVPAPEPTVGPARRDPHQEYIPAPEPTVGPARHTPHPEYVPAPEPRVGPARHDPHPEYVPAPEPTVGLGRHTPHPEYVPAPEPTVGSGLLDHSFANQFTLHGYIPDPSQANTEMPDSFN